MLSICDDEMMCDDVVDERLMKVVILQGFELLLRRSWDLLGRSWALLELLGAIFGRLGLLLGHSGGDLGVSWVFSGSGPLFSPLKEPHTEGFCPLNHTLRGFGGLLGASQKYEKAKPYPGNPEAVCTELWKSAVVGTLAA